MKMKAIKPCTLFEEKKKRKKKKSKMALWALTKHIILEHKMKNDVNISQDDILQSQFGKFGS